MKKAFIAIVAIAALAMGLFGGRSIAGTTTTYAGATFYITATNTATSWLTIPTGATQCEVLVSSGAPAGGGITDQYENSSGAVIAATGHAQIISNGEYISSIPSGETAFRVFVSNYNGPYVSGQLFCGATMPPPFWEAVGGFGTPSPLPLASVATGTTAYVYQTIQSIPVTCTWAPDGCYVTVRENAVYPNALPTAAGPLYPCIAVSGTPSPLPSSIAFDAAPAATPTAGAPCASSAPTNALAGGAPFAFATTGGQTAQTINNEAIQWSGILPSGSAWTFLCEVEGATATSVTVNGSCSASFIPF